MYTKSQPNRSSRCAVIDSAERLTTAAAIFDRSVFVGRFIGDYKTVARESAQVPGGESRGSNF